MKDSKLKLNKIIEEKGEEIYRLGVKLSCAYEQIDNQIKETTKAMEMIEQLKQEKAALLDENIKLLCKIRHLMEMDLGKRA